ncbi:MAG: hypothetical protein HZC29_00405 [Thaumarchaeota archaeon]|nr:hypothetical protein [Nitrososphaerota archaeon]
MYYYSWEDNTSGGEMFGTTLWFPYQVDNNGYERLISDFSCIKEYVPFVYQTNSEALRYLSEQIDVDSIVVTHHLPSTKSIHDKYFGSNLNRFFVSPEAEKIILEKKP